MQNGVGWVRNIDLLFFFFNDTATTEIYTLSLHDALPISRDTAKILAEASDLLDLSQPTAVMLRSEEHTSELQSRQYLVCRLLLEKKKNPAQDPGPLLERCTARPRGHGPGPRARQAAPARA